jgi:tRNA (pseudouridine54-N1)-methyltransferase
MPEISDKGDFHLKDLPGSGRRIDVLCRTLAACFDWAPTNREAFYIEAICLIGKSKCLRFRDPGTDIPRGEVSWAVVIKDTLQGNPPKFVSVGNLNLREIIEDIRLNKDANLWVLEETGIYVGQGDKMDFNAQNIFLIGDYRGFDEEALKVFDDHSIYRLSLGSTSYLTSHCVAAIVSMYEEMIHDGS